MNSQFLDSTRAWRYFVPILLLVGAYSIYRWATPAPRVDYATQVKPILNKHCLACHGGVKKNGDLSFLFREDVFAETASGQPAIVPGRPGRSELIRRITHPDPNQRMPPEGDPLSAAEIETLTQWVDQGAEWGRHWAYAPISSPPLPANDPDLAPIDRFVRARLPDSLAPAPMADCATLLRRVSLDLTGLPPTPERVARFCADPSEAAYAELVDSLLADPAYGEHRTAYWLDLARYADTKGFERDPHREIWLYRDWLIRAFNRDLPYDSFTLEQLAGDLLPHPTQDQYTATAFHRNTMSNDEGGTDNEEYRMQAVLDRVNTTWSVWLGTTMNCVQCHSHPYDPIRHEEYFRSYAYFNNTRDEDTHHDSPRLIHYQDEDSLRVAEIVDFIRALPQTTIAERDRAVAQTLQLLRIAEPKVHPHYFELLRNSAHGDAKYLDLDVDALVKLPAFHIGANTQLLIQFGGVPDGGWLSLRRDTPEGAELSRIPLRADYSWQKAIFTVRGSADTTDLYLSFQHPTAEKASVRLTWLHFFAPPGPNFAIWRNRVVDLLNEHDSPSVPIQLENSGAFRRANYVFERGNWLVPGAAVTPGVPGIFPTPPPGDADRLQFAHWIVSPDNPLTARVAVNRLWEQLFGRGLVATSEDFGSQGTPPSHPELLDWLAYEFMHSYQWSTKSLLRTIVLSRTYRQSARAPAEHWKADPTNRWLARGPRVRLTAEQVRDQALAVSGLLSRKRYGPSVMPPQPPGVWNIIYSGATWDASTGADRYRRALYTYWRRTSPYPSLVSFDAPSREFCVVRRIPTNTPLQALVTLNDPVYLEAAQQLATTVWRSTDEPEAMITKIYQRALFRPPNDAAQAELQAVFHSAQADYLENPTAARQLRTAQEELLFTPDEDILLADCGDPERCAELAALTTVANVVLNLDAFLTKE